MTSEKTWRARLKRAMTFVGGDNFGVAMPGNDILRIFQFIR